MVDNLIIIFWDDFKCLIIKNKLKVKIKMLIANLRFVLRLSRNTLGAPWHITNYVLHNLNSARVSMTIIQKLSGSDSDLICIESPFESPLLTNISSI